MADGVTLSAEMVPMKVAVCAAKTVKGLLLTYLKVGHGDKVPFPDAASVSCSAQPFQAARLKNL